MCFLISLFPMTVWMMFGFVVLYLTAKTTGQLQKFGRILAIWIFVLALALPICGAYLTISGKCSLNNIVCDAESEDDDSDCCSPPGAK